LFFFGIENGAEFAARSAIFNIVGIVTFLTFIGIYYAASQIPIKNTVIISTVFATVGFLLLAYYLEKIEFTVGGSVLIAVVAVIITAFIFRRNRKMQTGTGVKVTFNSIIAKGLFAGVIIAGVTSIASVAGPGWAGLLASFPATTLPLMLMVHHKYSTMHLHGMIKYIPTGSFSIIAYVLAVYYFYPMVGVIFGTVIAYGIATVVILLLYFIEDKKIFKNIRAWFQEFSATSSLNFSSGL